MLGLRTVDHAVPFQRCTNVAQQFELVNNLRPTARQLVAVHETPRRFGSAHPAAGFGLVTSDHAFPFHRSISVLPDPVVGKN
jgi:hypothetical protein